MRDYSLRTAALRYSAVWALAPRVYPLNMMHLDQPMFVTASKVLFEDC